MKGIIYPHQCFDYKLLPKTWKLIYFIRHNIVYDKRFLKARHDYYNEVNKNWIDNCPIKIITLRKLPKIKTPIEYFDPADNTIDSEIKKSLPNAQMLPSPSFILTRAECYDMPTYRMYDFYKEMRRRYNILVKDGQPIGGKWRLDEQNRDSAKHLKKIPPPHTPLFATSRGAAKRALGNFLKTRLRHFGQFQDAFTSAGDNLYHSLLSAPLNCGLLCPMEVIRAALAYYKRHRATIPLASVEGFIAQILGWREYMRALYYTRKVPKVKYAGHNKKVPRSWYDGSAQTKLPPVDNALRKVAACGYLHHIERLMVMGNIMFLMDISPREMYKWFLYMFIDSFPWVMYDNIYKMLQSPYISSSNYILKMSDYSRGDWCEKWDKLYHRQIKNNSKRFIRRIYA